MTSLWLRRVEGVASDGGRQGPSGLWCGAAVRCSATGCGSLTAEGLGAGWTAWCVSFGSLNGVSHAAGSPRTRGRRAVLRTTVGLGWREGSVICKEVTRSRKDNRRLASFEWYGGRIYVREVDADRRMGDRVEGCRPGARYIHSHIISVRYQPTARVRKGQDQE